MFKDIKIHNFRGISDLELKNLSDINLLVGSNNSGKTSILEAVFLLIGINNSELPLNINSFRSFGLIGEISWKSFFKNLNDESHIILEAKFGDKTKRELRIMPHTNSVKNVASINLMGSSTSTVEVNGLILKAKITNGKTKILESEIFVDSSKKDPTLVVNSAKDYAESKLGSFLSDSTVLNIDLPTRLNAVQIRKEKNEVLDILKEIEPRLKDIILGQEGIIYVDIGLPKFVPLQLMGDGLKKVLAVILAIMNTRDGVLLIDEIENGLHYKSQHILWESIYKASEKYNVQIIATTHSIETVRAFSKIVNKKVKSSLYRIENDNKSHSAIHFTQDKVISFIDSDWEMR